MAHTLHHSHWPSRLEVQGSLSIPGEVGTADPAQDKGTQILSGCLTGWEGKRGVLTSLSSHELSSAKEAWHPKPVLGDLARCRGQWS